MDDVNYQRGMLYMSANPSLNLPFSSSGGDPSNGSAALLNLYSREVKKFPVLASRIDRRVFRVRQNAELGRGGRARPSDTNATTRLPLGRLH